MAVGQGFSKVVTSGSVFQYDTGDVINSFKGKPTTNQLLTIGYTYGTQNQTYFKSNYGTEYDIIPGLGGQVLVNYCNFFNDYPGGSGACCPSVFYYGNFTVSPSTVYTYQIVYKTPDGYANANYMYHYEFGPGGYVTEYGLWDSSRTQDLGNGWTHAWGTFTSNAATNYFQTYLFHYQYTQTKIQIAGVMLTQGSTIIPPRQFIPVNTTRSNIQGLLDLTGNTTITTVNDTFDSNGGLMFDGTNTYLQLSSDVLSSSSPYTLNVVLNPADINNMANSFPWYNTYGNGFWHHVTSTGIAWRHQGQYGDMSGLNIQNGVWSMLSLTWDSSTLILYFNGTQVNSASCTAGYYNNGSARIGMLATRSSGYDYNYNGKAPVNQVYNRALTAKEIKQNYNHYKTRFNLP